MTSRPSNQKRNEVLKVVTTEEQLLVQADVTLLRDFHPYIGLTKREWE